MMVKFCPSPSFKSSTQAPPPKAFPTQLPLQGELSPRGNHSHWIEFHIFPQFLLIHPSMNTTIPLGAGTPEQHQNQFLPQTRPAESQAGAPRAGIPGRSREHPREEPSASREVSPKPPPRAAQRHLHPNPRSRSSPEAAVSRLDFKSL